MVLSNTDLAEKIRARGLKPTSQRIAILKEILSRKDHPNAEAIYQKLKDEYPALSLNTIYLNLESFVKKGIIQKINYLHKFARFDGDINPHHHFVCVRCNHIIDLHKVKIPKFKIPEELKVAKVYDQGIQINGICLECI
jgi:Fur family peroxide stress response transcriptional regulator